MSKNCLSHSAGSSPLKTYTTWISHFQRAAGKCQNQAWIGNWENKEAGNRADGSSPSERSLLDQCYHYIPLPSSYRPQGSSVELYPIHLFLEWSSATLCLNSGVCNNNRNKFKVRVTVLGKHALDLPGLQGKGSHSGNQRDVPLGHSLQTHLDTHRERGTREHHKNTLYTCTICLSQSLPRFIFICSN